MVSERPDKEKLTDELNESVGEELFTYDREDDIIEIHGNLDHLEHAYHAERRKQQEQHNAPTVDPDN